MAVKDNKLRKLVTVDKAFWERVRRYRFARMIETESEAMRRLMERGLDAEEAEGERRPKSTQSNPPPKGSKAKAK